MVSIGGSCPPDAGSNPAPTTKNQKPKTTTMKKQLTNLKLRFWYAFYGFNLKPWLQLSRIFFKFFYISIWVFHISFQRLEICKRRFSNVSSFFFLLHSTNVVEASSSLPSSSLPSPMVTLPIIIGCGLVGLAGYVARNYYVSYMRGLDKQIDQHQANINRQCANLRKKNARMEKEYLDHGEINVEIISRDVGQALRLINKCKANWRLDRWVQRKWKEVVAVRHKIEHDQPRESRILKQKVDVDGPNLIANLDSRRIVLAAIEDAPHAKDAAARVAREKALDDICACVLYYLDDE